MIDDYLRFARSLKARSGRFGPLLIGAAALALAALGAWILLVRGASVRPQRERLSAPVAEQTEEEAPAWLDEGKKGKSKNRFGLEGAADDREAHMDRESAREQAKNAGILGVLKSSPATSPYVRDAALGNDPMSALGALMGDQIGSNFGFSGLEIRGTGRGGAAEEPATDAKNEANWPRWKRSEPTRQLRARPRGAPPQAVVSADAQPAPSPTNPAEELLARHSTLQGVQFIDADRYFANSYVPGDPELRALQARVRGYDRTSLLPEALRAARFDDASQRVAQPFDAPGQAALAVYVSASERGITSARRMLLQVGLQATPRYSGRRPTMNVAIVLDAREPLDATTSANVRALLAAFADARDPSDRLSLFAAGPGGGQLVAADAFRHGPLQVALQRLQSERGGATLGLADALRDALQSVRGSDDTNAPLGSSVAILVAPRALGSELAQLEALAHQSAVEGVPVSVFGAGPDADPEQLSQLALAGQGNRRLLATGADAAPAVDRELSAVARVVARAVRLRVHLASGVRLVGVLGSHPLDEEHAERVREAENSIDQRLRRNLGIDQDRGQDEEGVQIVIPSFYAGDSHVVLLDVVAEGPGAIADVSVRYKDLVQLANGTARESLWLPNLELARGALQRNVLKNLVAHELADRLRSAGDVLANDPDSARRQLDQAQALLDSLGAAVPELRGDRELEQDRALTSEYRTLLARVAQPAQRQFAADSLRFASLLKLQPRPEGDPRSP
ncbi:MAG TPA: vWA domain-containing protein [Polyangiales bacterium]|nr:vWA domain-containing protein [Polyangiales bacterium]